MAFAGRRRFVGLGFGPIQAGLFVYEAHVSGIFAAPLVVDVRADLVQALRANGGHYWLNIARTHGVDSVSIGPVAAADSTRAADRVRITAAIARADDVATGLPSVDYYCTGDLNSPHLLLAAGLTKRTARRPVVVYTAENHRRAAALLEQAVLEAVPASERDSLRERARFVDTVIGKMSGIVSDVATIEALDLASLTPTTPAAYLVEEFDRILISRIDDRDGPGSIAHSAIPVFEQKADLAPFEAAKLLGHNATHALAAFLGRLVGLDLVADLVDVPGAMGFLEDAFVDEAGAALVSTYGGADPLFTPAGFRAYATDLLRRMTNPFLHDTIERAARNPARKLGWDDRLVGTMRLCLSQGIRPQRYAMGTAAALAVLDPKIAAGDSARVEPLLRSCWRGEVAPAEASEVAALVREGSISLRRWLVTGRLIPSV